MLTIYNLSLGICMRSEFMFLSTIIHGPNNSGRNIDVCLQPLIDELAQLWSSRALTYDVFDETEFSYEGSFDVDYQ